MASTAVGNRHHLESKDKDNMEKPLIKQKRRRAGPWPSHQAGHQRTADVAGSDGSYSQPVQQGGKR